MKPCLAGSPTELIDEILADFNRSDCELDLTDDMTMSFLKMATKWKQIDDGYVPPDIFQELKIAPPKFFKVEHYYDLLDVMNKDMQDLVYTFVLKDIERSARASPDLPLGPLRLLPRSLPRPTSADVCVELCSLRTESRVKFWRPILNAN